LDEVRTFSLLGGRRVVVVTGADGFISRHRAALERYCAAPADSGTLVLECNSLPGNQKLHKIIAQHGGVVRFDALKSRDVAGWIVSRARSVYGKALDVNSAWLLRDMCGSELGVLDTEIAKLAMFVRDRSAITQQDIEALVGRHREEDVFGVIDAIAEGDAAKALAQWERVLATDRAAPARAIGGLAYGVRKLLDLKQQAERGASMFALSKQAFCSAEVLERRLRMNSKKSLQQQLCDLMESDLASKTGLSTVPVAIERFIIRHCVRPRQARRPA
jgi:DNA polymerase-3 subunit delta